MFVLLVGLCACSSTEKVENTGSDVITNDTEIGNSSAITMPDLNSEPVAELEVVEGVSEAEPAENVVTGEVQFGNPWTNYDTVAEAEEVAGFEFKSIRDAEINSTSVMKTDEIQLIQGTFYDGENEISVRKSTQLGDNSGVYGEFVVEEIDRDGTSITLKGEGDKFFLAYWDKDGYSYSILCGTAVSKEILDTYINVVFE